MEGANPSPFTIREFQRLDLGNSQVPGVGQRMLDVRPQVKPKHSFERVFRYW